MANKLAWRDIYKDFRSRYPNLRKNVIGYQPYDYLMIRLLLNDKTTMTYSYLSKECCFISE